MIQSVRNDIKTLLSGVNQMSKRDNLSLHFNRLVQGIDKKGETTQKEAVISSMVKGYSTQALQVYEYAFKNWRRLLSDDKYCFLMELETTSPTVVGKGDQNVHEFGISLQLPWGTPFVPGSAVKGLLSSWAGAGGGDSWKKTTLTTPGGDYSVTMFGGKREDGELEAGCLDFLDAWWIPQGVNEREPFQEDIINVHYKSYYRDAKNHWPDGVESPVPVKFLAVRPGQQFLFAIRGDKSWRKLAGKMLREAVADYGFGSKTRVGYGRFVYVNTPEEYAKLISEYSVEQLATFYASKKNDNRYTAVFQAEVQKRDFCSPLKDLFKAFRPMVAMMEELKSLENPAIRDIRRIRDQYIKSLTPEMVDPLDPVAGEIVAVCRSVYNDMPQWLECFACTAEDLIRGKTSDEILILVESYERSYPTITDLKAAIENHADLSEEDRDLCLMGIAEKMS